MNPFALLLAGLAFGPASERSTAHELPVRVAVDRAIRRIETGLRNYPKHRQCFSCHHQAMAVLSLTAAQEHGFRVDHELLKKQVPFSLRTFRNRSQIAKGQGVGGDSTSVVYALQMLAAVGHPRDETTDALIEYLLAKQRKDGAWPKPFLGDRPPTMGSAFTNTGPALWLLRQYAPPPSASGAGSLQARIDAALAKGRQWLLTNSPRDNEDKVFHLHGLVHAAADAGQIESARQALSADQRSDGSWSQLPSMSGDAYATATALVALRRAGLPASAEVYRKGTSYLLATQGEHGGWVVTTRSKPLQAFFDNGDPGGKSQFISFAATNWAVLALLEILPRDRSLLHRASRIDNDP